MRSCGSSPVAFPLGSWGEPAAIRLLLLLRHLLHAIHIHLDHAIHIHLDHAIRIHLDHAIRVHLNHAINLGRGSREPPEPAAQPAVAHPRAQLPST